MNKLSDITLVDNTINPYERVRNLVKGNEHYNADLWEWARNESQDDFNAYISALTSNKLPSLQALNDKWAYSSVPESNKIFMLSVASNKDALLNEETRKKRTYDIYDAEGKVADKKDLGELTDYEYYDTIFSLEAAAHNEYQRQVDLEQWKQDRGWLYNALTDVATVIGDFAMGVVETVSGFFEVIADIGQTLHYVGDKIADWYSGNNSVNLEEKLRNVWGNEQLIPTQQLIQEYNEGKRYYTTLVDVWGGQSFWAQLAESTAQSIGNIVGAVALSSIPGGQGKAAATLSKVIHGVSYYGTMFERSVQGSVAKDINHEHSIYEIMAVQGAETAFEWASEKALGNLLGFTRAGALTLGEKQTGMLIKNPLARFMINAVKEGSEEVIQEFGDWIITSIADAWTGKNNFYSDPMTFERMAQSFLAGFLTESVLSGVNAVATKVKETKWVNEFINSQNDYDIDTKTGTIFSERDKFKVELDNVKKAYAEGKPLNVVNDLGDPVSIEKGGYLYGDVNNAEHSYDALYNKKISEIETKYNDFVKQSDKAQARIDERVQNRRITFESASGKQKHEFKHGILGLFNALQMLNDYTWKLGNDKRSQKLASWLREIMSTGFQTISSLYGEMGSKAFADFTQLIAKFEINDTVVVEQGGDSAVTTGVNAMKFTVENAISIANDLISKYQIDKETAKKAESVIKRTTKLKSEAAKNNEKVKNVEKTETDIINGMIFDNKEKTFKNAEGKSVEVSDDKDANQKAVDNASELADKGLAVCVKTEGDTNVFADRFGVIIPIQNITDSVDAILTSAGLNNNIFAASADSHLSPAMRQQIVDEFNDINSTGIDFTFEDILKIMLGTNNSELLTHVLYLSDIETVTYFANLCEKLNKNTLKSMVGDNDKNPIALSTVSSAKQIVNNLLPALIEYAQTQPIKDSNLLGAIKRTVGENSSVAKQIDLKQYNFMLEEEVINNSINNIEEKRRDKVKAILEARLSHYIPSDGMMSKEKVREGLYSDKKNERKKAFYELDDFYDFIYSGVYNNQIYMTRNSCGNLVFNNWLKKNNLTIKIINNKNITEQNILMAKFRNDSLERYSFEFTMDEDMPIQVIDLKPNDIKGTTKIPSEKMNYARDVYSAGSIKMSGRDISYQTISYRPVYKVFAGILKSKDDVNNAFLTTNNLVDSPEDYIAEDLLKKIEKKYGTINRDIIYEFLNAYLADEYNGSMGIVPNQNNDLVLIEYNNADNFFSKELKASSNELLDLSKYKEVKTYSISEFISKSKLVGELENVKLKFEDLSDLGDNIGGYYNPTSNTITIDSSYVKNIAENEINTAKNKFRFVVLHEFTHAIQYYNGLNQGMDFVNVEDIPNWVAEDVAKHVDFEGRGDKQELAFWLYYSTSGEFAAEGLGSSYTKYPAIRRHKHGVDVLITPWGNSYTIKDLKGKKQAFVKDGFSYNEDCPTKWKEYGDWFIKTFPVSVVDFVNCSFDTLLRSTAFSMILPDGRVIDLSWFGEDKLHMDVIESLEDDLPREYLRNIACMFNSSRWLDGKQFKNTAIRFFAPNNITNEQLGVSEILLNRFTDNNLKSYVSVQIDTDEGNVGSVYKPKTFDEYSEAFSDVDGSKMLRRLTNRLYEYYYGDEDRSNIQAHVKDYDKDTLNEWSKTRRVPEQAYRDAKRYIKQINTAKERAAKSKNFGKSTKGFEDIPTEKLIQIKTGEYSNSKDELMKRAQKIVAMHDNLKTGKQRSAERKAKGEIYNSGPISATKAKGTLAQYYLKFGKYSNYRPVLTAGMRNFLYSLNSENMGKLNYELAELFNPNTFGDNPPTQRDIFDYIRTNYNNMNEFTFNLIRDCFFPNSPIKSSKQLSDLAESTLTLKALNSAIKEKDVWDTEINGKPFYANVFPDLLNGDLKSWFKKFREYDNSVRQGERTIDDIIEQKEKQWRKTKDEHGNEVEKDFDMGAAALFMLKYFDGTPDSLDRAGNNFIQSIVYPETHRTRTVKENSFDTTIKGKRQGTDKDMTLEDTLADKEDRYVVAEMSVLKQKALDIVAFYADEKRREVLEKSSKYEQQYKGNEKALNDLKKWTTTQLDKLTTWREQKEENIRYNMSNEEIAGYIVNNEEIEERMYAAREAEMALPDFERLDKSYRPVSRTFETASTVTKDYIRRNLNNTINQYTYSLLSDDLKKYVIVPKDARSKYKLNNDEVNKLRTVKELDDLREKFKSEISVIKRNLRAFKAGKLINEKANKVVKETEKRTAEQVRETERKLKEEQKTNKITANELAKAKERITDLKQKLKEAEKEIDYKNSKKYVKAILDENKTVLYETEIPQTKITVKSNVIMPPTLYKMLNVIFTNKEVSEIQSLNIDDDIKEHEVISTTEFFKQTAHLWAELTDGEAQQIIDFIKAAKWGGDDVTLQEVNKVTSLSNLILYSLLEWDNEERISLTDNQKKEIKDIIYSTVSNGARAMQQYGVLLARTEPWRAISKQLKYELGVEISDEDWEQGQKYLQKGQFDEFEQHTQKIKEKLIEKYKKDISEHKVRHIANIMIDYMRAAMLSAPKTTIRNRISNYSITALRKISEPIGNQVAKFALAAQNFFRQKKGLEQINGYREGQVDLGKKIDWSQYGELNTEIDNFYNSAFMALFHDNVTKYDIFGNEDTDKVTAKSYWKLRVDQLRREAQREMMFDPKWIKYTQKVLSKLGFAYNFRDNNDKLGFIDFVMKMQSDDQFIDKRSKEIFKRLLIENNMTQIITDLIAQAKQVNVDPYSMLMTNDTYIRLLSKAYGQAAYEYMHRPSFFGSLSNYLNKNYPNVALAYRLMLPFIAGGFLWWSEANKYTPWHLVKSLIDFWRLDKKITANEEIYKTWQEGDKRGRRPMFTPEFTEYNVRTDIGKGIVGTVAIVLASALAALGFIIKDDDDDKYKFNFGSFTVDVSSLFGMDMFSTGAAFTIATRNKESFLDILDAALSSTFENFFMSDIIKDMRYNNGVMDYISDKGFSIIGNFIPNFYKAALRAANRYKLKYDQGIVGDLQYLLYQVWPIAWTSVPKRIDPYTGEIEVRNTNSILVNVLNEMALFGGVTVKTDMPSKLEKELMSIDAGIGNLAGKYEDIGQLNTEKLNIVYGKLNNKLLNELINDKVAYEVTDKRTNKKVTRKYSQMTTEQKQEVVSRIKTKNAKYAKIYTWTSEGHKYYGTLEEKKELAKLGIMNNIYTKTNKLNGFVK